MALRALLLDEQHVHQSQYRHHVVTPLRQQDPPDHRVERLPRH